MTVTKSRLEQLEDLAKQGPAPHLNLRPNPGIEQAVHTQISNDNAYEAQSIRTHLEIMRQDMESQYSFSSIEGQPTADFNQSATQSIEP